MRHTIRVAATFAALLLAATSAQAQVTLRYGGTTPPLTMDPHSDRKSVV